MPIFRRRTEPLRNFLYVSDAKLEMLYEQIDPATRRRVSAEAKVDLKLASVTLRQTEPQPAARIAKLRVVEQYITQHHSVGSIENPGSAFFRGSLPMRWGWLNNHDHNDVNSTGGRDTVFFRGRTRGQVVVLAGSRRHVIGEEPHPGNRNLHAHSATPNILAVIAQHISGNPRLQEYWQTLKSKGVGPTEDSAAAHDPPDVGLLEAARVELQGPFQQLEFLAVPLLKGRVNIEKRDDWRTGWREVGPFPERERVQAVLGTPIYVALGGDRAAP